MFNRLSLAEELWKQNDEKKYNFRHFFWKFADFIDQNGHFYWAVLVNEWKEILWDDGVIEKMVSYNFDLNYSFWTSSLESILYPLHEVSIVLLELYERIVLPNTHIWSVCFVRIEKCLIMALEICVFQRLRVFDMSYRYR